MKKKLENITGIVLYGILAYLVVWIVYRSGTYPGGSDAMFHLYKGDILYREILKGNFYPLLDPMWYNGVELLRYWAPLPVYALALCQGLAGGSMFGGYLLFVGCIFFFGAAVWLWIGNRHGRTGLGAFIGALWFFMPNNLYTLFAEGNLPKSLCMVFLPWLLEQIYSYLTEKRWRNLLGITGCFSLITLCHLGYAGMILLAVLLFLVIYVIRFGGIRKCFHVLLAMALSVMLAGWWLVPALKGGIASTVSSQVMETFFQDALVSLNPLYRMSNGAASVYYFGLAAFLTAIIGIFFGKNKSGTFFGCALVMFLCTTTSMYLIISHMPGSRYLWMLWFVSIALCMILFGLVLWGTLKKQWLRLFCLLLVLDAAPSLPLIYGDLSGRTVEERMDEMDEYSLLAEAKEITTQRIALMDLSATGATGAFLTSGYTTPKPGAFGAGWQAAATADNIMMLNEALETGRYYYMFDRCLELGNDTVLVRIDCLHEKNQDLDKVKEAAEASGYYLVTENESYLLYHLDTYEQFGTVSSYSAIGIGKPAMAVTMDYPAMEYGKSDNLNDYSLDELRKYQLVFLNGFTYDNKVQAEALVTQLSEAGVRIVIQADGIPVDEHTGIQSFLDVTCQPIVFSNGYPLLDTIDGTLDCDLFPSGYTSWRAMYLIGLDECWGKFDEIGEELEFYGTVKNDNIVMIGLNLSYFYSLTLDEGVGKLLSHAMLFSETELPERTLVPLEVEYGQDRIVVRSEYDNVNTALAWHDIFGGTEGISRKNNLTFVNQGETVIRLHYPYFWEGMSVSILGLILTVLFLVMVWRLWRRRYVTKIEITEVVRPVKGESPAFTAAVPGEVKYTMSQVDWYDGEGRKLEKDFVFEKGKYRIAVTVSANAEEHFSRELKATVNGLKADRTEFLETDKRVLVEMTYEVIEPFRFLQQPGSLEGVRGDTVTVKWMISKVPRVGYLQVLEGENWIICDTVPREAEWELTLDISCGDKEECTYRLTYIMPDGRLEHSETFTVKWREKEDESEPL